MLPSVKITKGDGFTGVSRPSPDGVLAIVAPSEKGTANLAAVYGRQDVALAAVGNGPLVDDFAYIAAVSGNQQVVVPPTTSTAALYGSVDTSKMGASTSAPTAGSSAPLDDYQVIVTFVAPGTIGVAGITYTYSFDAGATVSGVQNLGTNNSITLALPAPAGGTSSGVSFNLGPGSVVANASFACNVSHARMNNSDLTAALEALRVSRLNFEGILIDNEATTASISAVDVWLQAREAEGRYYFALLNTRHKNLPAPTGEDEATFAAAMTALVANSSSMRLAVGTDAADLTSQVTGCVLPRPTALFVAARAMSTAVGVDPARVLDGPLSGAQIEADTGGPKWHDEYLYPGLDDQRLMTLRSFPGTTGTFLTNAPLLSPSDSDWVYLQHARIANKAARIAYPLLQAQLSTGLTKNPPDPNTHAIYIAEHDALRIEGLINKAIKSQLAGQVSDIAFVLSRTDDLSQVPVTVTGELQIKALAYVKTIKVNEHFVNSIQTNV